MSKPFPILASEHKRAMAQFNTNHSPFRNDPNHGRFGTVIQVRLLRDVSPVWDTRWRMTKGELRYGELRPRGEVCVSRDVSERNEFWDLGLKLGVDVEEVIDGNG